MDARSARSALDLAREPDFDLGGLSVRPSQRQILAGARQETVQPRIMQVLVALAQAEGGVLSRDDLIERCWAGVVVGDDAITRCIVKLRQIAALTTPPSFEIETVARVGYRLRVAASPGPAALPAPPQAASVPVWSGTRAWAGRALAAGLMGALALGLTGALRGTHGGVDIIGVGGAPGALTDGLALELGRLAGSAPRVTYKDQALPGTPDLMLDVTLRQAPGGVRAEASLRQGTARQAPLWSGTTGPETTATTARTHLALLVARVVGCAETLRAPLRTAPEAVLRPLLAACVTLDDALSDAAGLSLDAWQAAADADPRNGNLPAIIAVVATDIAALAPTRARFDALEAEARAALARAGALGARPGLLALAAAARTPGSLADTAALEAATRADPDLALLRQRHAHALSVVGRMEEAAGEMRRAVALEPASAWLRGSLVGLLAAAGYTEDARRALAEGETAWPDSDAMRDARFRFDLRYGDPTALIAAIEAGRQVPNAASLWQHSHALAFVRARANPAQTPEAVTQALAFAHSGGVPIALQHLVQLGRVDTAYALLEDPGMFRRLRGSTDVLFRAYMRPFWQDRRFMPLAARLGLAAYWLRADEWPDFCSDAALPYRCDVEARRLAGG